jgi:hypothetical protein
MNLLERDIMATISSPEKKPPISFNKYVSRPENRPAGGGTGHGAVTRVPICLQRYKLFFIPQAKTRKKRHHTQKKSTPPETRPLSTPLDPMLISFFNL